MFIIFSFSSVRRAKRSQTATALRTLCHAGETYFLQQPIKLSQQTLLAAPVN